MKKNITRDEALDFMKQGYKIRHESYEKGWFLRMDKYGMIKDHNGNDLGYENEMFWKRYKHCP